MTSSEADDTSSEDDLDKFKESVDQQFLTDELYSKNPTQRRDEKPMIPSFRSLRRNINKEDEAQNIFHVTPEFQNYVAKHLSAKLEEDLRQREVTTAADTLYAKQKRKGGIRLLSTSVHKLKVPKLSDEDVKEHNSTYSKQIMINFDEDALLTKCKLVAVGGDDILCKKGVDCWSNRSKAEVFCYKKGKRGAFEYQEKPFVTVTYK